MTQLVKGYKDNNIPLGAVNIDSTWETQFGNFDVNTEKFPDFAKLVQELHDQDLRVILWQTSMVNVENPDYQMCIENEFLVRDSNGTVFPLHWWHGDGGLLDYTNPKAVAWWHSQMDKVLDVGVDGFKCDGTDPYIMEYVLTGGAMGYQNQSISYPEYAHMYYRDFFYYTRERRGDAGLIMSRPSDCLVDQLAKVCWGYSPRDVVYSGWVGDDDATFNGLRGCARKVIYSAWDGYANTGCDIDGYRDTGEPVMDGKELFIRWAQFSAFLPLMENGGGGEHRPWMYDRETVDTYRTFAQEHHRLAPYLLTVGADAMDHGTSAVIPLAETDVIRNKEPTTFSYQLGPAILVHPVMTAFTVNATSISEVEGLFPGDNSTQWLDWWSPTNPALVKLGGSRSILTVPLRSYSVYARRGALIPTQRTPAPSDRSVVFVWYCPFPGSEAAAEAREPASFGEGLQGAATLLPDDSAESAGGLVLTATITAHAGTAGAGFDFIGISEPKNIVITNVNTGSPADLRPANKTTVSDGCRYTYTKISSTLSVFCDTIDVGVTVVGTDVVTRLA